MHDCIHCGCACYCHGDIDDCQYAHAYCDGCGCHFDDIAEEDDDYDDGYRPGYDDPARIVEQEELMWFQYYYDQNNAAPGVD